MPTATQTVKFDFDTTPFDRVAVRCTGTALVLERGFQMQLGRDGYKLEVIECDTGDYAPGAVIRIFPHSVRGAA